MLTTLTHKMVDKSRKRGGGRGYENDGGYATEESEKENTWPRNIRGRNKRPRSQQQQQSIADNKNSGDWKYTHKMKYNPNSDWTGKKKAWFRSATYAADEKMKGSDQ